MDQNFYIPKNFEETELVDPTVYDYFKKRGWLCWPLFNPLLLRTLQSIRDTYSRPIIVNNWSIGGPYKYRGFRDESCPIGEKFSAHKRGCAVDFDLKGYSAHDIIDNILRNPWDDAFKYITFVEVNVSWVHIDVSNFDKVKYGIQKIDPLNVGDLYVAKSNL